MCSSGTVAADLDVAPGAVEDARLDADLEVGLDVVVVAVVVEVGEAHVARVVVGVALGGGDGLLEDLDREPVRVQAVVAPEAVGDAVALVVGDDEVVVAVAVEVVEAHVEGAVVGKGLRVRHVEGRREPAVSGNP